MNTLTIPDATAPRRTPPASMIEELQKRFGGRCSLAMSVREQHGKDESVFNIQPPEVVVFVQNTEEVASIVSLAAKHKVPVIPYGAGSALEGHFLAVQGGVCIDVSCMNKIISINTDDFTATVQPGVTREELNVALRHEGLFFPVDPGANASVGGMVASRASGTNTVMYGTMRENVRRLEVVMPSGEVIHTGTRAYKSSAGYDLTRLFVGSEGTLGVITEVTLTLYPLPEAISAAICAFTTIGDAVRATIMAIQMGVPLSRCELMDANAVRAVNKADHIGLKEAPHLIMEFAASSSTAVREQAETMAEIVQECGGENFEWAERPEERNRLWAVRHRAYLSGLQLRPGCRAVTTDVCVPISELANSVVVAIDEVEACGLPYFVVGHVGDGNFHMCYLIDPSSAQEYQQAETLSTNVVRRGIAVGGTCTGEHGIGIHKCGFLIEEAGAGAVAVMRSIKHAFDPDNIMNPGKIFSWQA